MRILYLNLDSRPDRKAQVEDEFAKLEMEVDRVSAIGGDNPMLAFNQSVYKAMEIAKGDSLLLFEDDVVFDPTLHRFTILTLLARFADLPANAMTLHYGANIMGQWEMPSRHDAMFALLPNAWQSHATYYSRECVQFILDNLRTDVMDEENNIFDDWLRRKVLHQRRSYITKPMICYQRPSFSNIWNCESNYVGVHTDGNQYLKLHA